MTSAAALPPPLTVLCFLAGGGVEGNDGFLFPNMPVADHGGVVGGVARHRSDIC